MQKSSLPLPTTFQIGNKNIANESDPFIIAEAGSNFNQQMDTAFRLIDAAAEAGADAVKFQLFQPEALYPKGTPEFDAVSKVCLNPDWIPSLFKHAHDQKLVFMASAFDFNSLETLLSAGVLAHKVASSEATNFPLLSRMAKSGLPIILATGMCDMVDIHEAVSVCLRNGNANIALLQCTSLYPTAPNQLNLKVMDNFKTSFGGVTGLSDHTQGFAASVAAVARGAAVIEKHFTLDRTSEGPDHFYALEPGELTQLISMLREANLVLGDGIKQLLTEEAEYGRREGVYAAKTLEAGAKISSQDIETKRPAIGIRARYRQKLVGSQATANLAKGQPIGWDDIRW